MKTFLFRMKGLNLLILKGLLCLIACQSPPKPIEVKQISFPDSSGVFPINVKWRMLEGSREMFIDDPLQRVIMHYRNDCLINQINLDSVLNFEGLDQTLLGFVIDGNHMYLMTYTFNAIVKYNLLSKEKSLHWIDLGSLPVKTMSVFNESPMVILDSHLVVPVSHYSTDYATSYSVLREKFSQPKAVVLDKRDFSVLAFIGYYDPILQNEYFNETYHYQAPLNDGLAISGFINDTILMYDQSFQLTNKIAAPSKFYQPLEPITQSESEDQNFLMQHRMEGFFYSNLKYSSALDVLIRSCWLPDNFVEDGLIQLPDYKPFSLQFFQKGELKNEVLFSEGQYFLLSFQVVGDKIIAFKNQEDESNHWEYHVYAISDFLQ